jgi:hypothetical protein
VGLSGRGEQGPRMTAGGARIEEAIRAAGEASRSRRVPHRGLPGPRVLPAGAPGRVTCRGRPRDRRSVLGSGRRRADDPAPRAAPPSVRA